MSTHTRSELTPQTGAKFLDRDSTCAPAARIAAFLASTVQVRCTAFAARGTSRAAAAMHKLTFPQRPSSCCILLYVQNRCAAQRTQCALQQHCSHRTPSHTLASTRPTRTLQHPRTQHARTGIRARSTHTRVSNGRALTRARSAGTPSQQHQQHNRVKLLPTTLSLRARRFARRVPCVEKAH